MRTESRLILLWLVTSCLLAGLVSSAAAAGGGTMLYWTAPGNDSLTGQASAYDVRYSLAPITTSNFTLASRISGVPAPKIAGSPESLAITNLPAGTSYYLALKTGDPAGNWSRLSNVVYVMIGTTAVRAPPTLSFSAPWPNPARAAAHWSYVLPGPGAVVIDVYDAAGRHIAGLERGWMDSGPHEATWDLRDAGGHTVAPGIYLLRATYGGQAVTKRLSVAP